MERLLVRTLCPMSIEVRRLSSADVAVLDDFAPAFDGPIDPRSTAAFLGDPRHHLLVTWFDGHATGFVSATEILHPDKPMELFLNELAVIEDWRRRGVATALLDALERLAVAQGAAQIWVLTDEMNAAAVATYRRAGGTWNGEHSIMFEIEPTGRGGTAPQ